MITEADQAVLDVLREKGDALTTVRDIEHFAYFPNQDQGAPFIYKCLKAGLRLRNTSEPPEPGAGFGAILFHKDVPSEDVLDRVIALLKDLAAERQGRYDGWETQVHS